MPLQKQNLSVSFAQGVDTKTDPKQVMAGKLTSLTNGIFQTTSSIRKRNGYTALPQSITPTGTISSAAWLGGYRSELHLLSSSTLYGYIPSLSAWTAAAGTFDTASLATSSVFQNTVSNYSQDSAYHSSGLQAFTWEGANVGVSYSLIDRTTGQQRVSGTLIKAGAFQPKVLQFNGYFCFFYNDGGTIKLGYTSATAPSTLTTVTVGSNAGTLGGGLVVYDVTVINAKIFVAYLNNASGTTLKSIDTSFVVSAGTAYAAEAPNPCICVFGDSSDNCWVGYYNGTAFKTFVVDYTLSTTVLFATVVETIASGRKITARYSTSNARSNFYYQTASVSPQMQNAQLKTSAVTIGGTVGTHFSLVRGLALSSRVFTYGGSSYVLTCFDSLVQPTYFLYNLTANIVTAKIAGGLADTENMVTAVNQITTGVYQFSYLLVNRAIDTGTTVVLNTGVSSAEITFDATPTGIDIGQNLHLTGGMLAMYDGASVVEHGFHYYPEAATLGTSTTGGVLPAGSYEYCSVYEWTDNQGQLHRSAPSAATTAVLSGGASTNSATIDVPTLRLTAKSNVVVALYRTTNAGSQFYRLATTANSTTADSVSFSDTNTTDGSLTGLEPLYTNGGEVENIAAPAPLAIATYKSRLVLIPAENPYSWWFSKDVIPGSPVGSPVEFSDLFVQNVDQRDGGLTTAAQLDDKLILFKRTRIFMTAGEGPAPSGANNDFGSAQTVSTDTGCSNKYSVVATPDGLMFQSPKGIYLLDRSLGVQYIGADVEAYNSYAVTSARLVENTTQVRFTLSSGVALVYDYLYRQWSVFSNHSAVAATIYQGAYTFVTAAGLVSQESSSVYTDNGAFVQLRLQTSWLSFAGLQGFQRIYEVEILGDYESAHTLNAEVAYDFIPTPTQVSSVAPSSAPPYQWRLHLARQKCEAFQLTLYDTQTPSYGEGLRLSAIGLLVGLKGGLSRLPAQSSFG